MPEVDCVTLGIPGEEGPLPRLASERASLKEEPTDACVIPSREASPPSAVVIKGPMQGGKKKKKKLLCEQVRKRCEERIRRTMNNFNI